MDLYVIFFIAALILLTIEVLTGFVSGVALAAAMAFFILGLIELTGLPSKLNHYLMIGCGSFALSMFLVLRIFRAKRANRAQADINEY
jgi:hypothetical protein